MAWTSINSIPIEILIFTVYISAIFWTLGYDTIYGAQDIIDDEIIGVKSTSIKFKSMLKNFVLNMLFNKFLCIFVFFLYKYEFFFFIIPFWLFYNFNFSNIYFNKQKPETCLKAFKINNYSGFYLFLAFFNFIFIK